VSANHIEKAEAVTGNLTRSRVVINIASLSIVNLLRVQRKLALLVFSGIDMFRFDISRGQSKPQLVLRCHGMLEGSC
jgi:hypothetical protein